MMIEKPTPEEIKAAMDMEIWSQGWYVLQKNQKTWPGAASKTVYPL